MLVGVRVRILRIKKTCFGRVQLDNNVDIDKQVNLYDVGALEVSATEDKLSVQMVWTCALETDEYAKQER